MSGPESNDTAAGDQAAAEQRAPSAAPVPPPTVAMPQQPQSTQQQAWSVAPQYTQPPLYTQQSLYGQTHYEQQAQYGPPQQYAQQPYPVPPRTAPHPGVQYAPASAYPAVPQPFPQQQYPQPPGSGQFGQGGYPQGPYPQPAVAGESKSRRLLWIGLAVAAVVVTGAGVAGIIVGLSGATTLDRGAAQRGVEQVLTESYGLTGVADVTCPAGREVDPGTAFTCTLTVEGQPQQVTVTFTDDAGTYEVSRPTAG